MTRRAYTFIELLVVMAILGILVALLLPAVQAAREAGRRMSCANNIVQLAIAVQQYEMAHGVYPTGTVNDTRPIRNQPIGYHHNWLIQLLPFLEQKNAYRHVDRTVGVYHANNRPVRRLDFPVLHCPSRDRGHKAFSDYAGVHNDVEAPIDINNNGVFFLNSRVRYEDLVDGSSNTLFFGEKYSYPDDLGWMSGTRATLRNTGVPVNWFTSGAFRARQGPSSRAEPPEYPLGVEEGEPAAGAPPQGNEMLEFIFGPTGAEAEFWRQGSSTYDRSLAGDEPPDAEGPNRPAFKRPVDPLLAVGGFGSVHPGGALFALGDSSVRYTSQSVDLRVYAQAGNRADRELQSDQDF